MTAANNPNFNPEKYTNIASNHLVVYSIYFLYKDGDEIRAEDIISACFTLFPKKFCLRTYPQWPDSALVGRRLHDCEKSGWITVRIDTGFKLTAKGNRLAEKVAEELGAEIRRKEKPKRIEKTQVKRLQADKLRSVKTAESAPGAKPASVESQTEEKIKAAAETPKPAEKLAAPAVKPAPVKPKVKKAKEKPIEALKPAPIKPKVEKAKEKRIETLKPAPAKPKVKKAKEKRIETVKPAPAKPKVEKAKEKRIEAVKPAPVKPAPKVKSEPIAKPSARVAPQPVVQRPLPAPTPSAEEKTKAGKFVKMMEASDAYRLYKKNGANANIGEFDFRSLLLCTMESSHETLARNVELFKGYAEMHNRKDLIAFLTVCREKFAHLLTPEKKAAKKFK